MKRVQISSGEFVNVSDAMAQKAARIFASGASVQARMQAAKFPEAARSATALLGRGRVKLREDESIDQTSTNGRYYGAPTAKLPGQH